METELDQKDFVIDGDTIKFKNKSEFEFSNSFLGTGNKQRQYLVGEGSKRNIVLDSVMLNEYSLKSSEIVFNLNTPNYIDPHSLKFHFTIRHDGSPVQLDSSIHSMISKLEIKVNNEQVEYYENYNRTKKFEHDLTLSIIDRIKRRNDEGFATNIWGSNEYVLSKTGDENRAGVDKTEFVNSEISYGTLVNKNEEIEINKTFISEFEKSILKNDNNLGNIGNKSNEYGFKLPVESCYFGSKVEEKNWRLIPMKNMKLQIIFTVNNDFWFYYEKQDNNLKSATVKLLHPKLHYTEYEFSQELEDTIDSSIKLEGGLVYEYLKFNLESMRGMSSLPHTYRTELLTGDLRRLRALYFVCYDTQNNKNKHVRPFSQFNSGYSQFTILTKNGDWPSESSFENRSAYYPIGKKSVRPLYEDILNLRNFKEYEICINEATLSVINDSSYLKTLNYKSEEFLSGVSDSNKKDNLKKGVENARCTSMCVLKFDTLPHKNLSTIGGIDLDRESKKEIMLSKSEGDVLNTTTIRKDIENNQYKLGCFYSETLERVVLDPFNVVIKKL